MLIYKANRCVGRPNRPAYLPFLRNCLVAVSIAATLPAGAQAQRVSPELQAPKVGSDRLAGEVRAFYQTRGNRTLWNQGSRLGPQADALVHLVRTAELDGLDPDRYRARSLASAVRKARNGSPSALGRAELLLSQTLVAYVRDMRRPRDVGMTYVDPELAPGIPLTSAILADAAAAPSLQQYLDDVRFMHPVYGQLRRALEEHLSYDGGRPEEMLLRLNMDRARALPSGSGRHVLVDAAGARLWLYENGEVRDTMKVIVGKPTEQTPMMAGLIRFASLNPYWNIPPDLVQLRVAQEGVLRSGLPFLKKKRYQVLSDWSDDAKVINPAKVDWKAVGAGTKKLPVRQLPGADNAMGRVKYMFPNQFGVYLHDTPDKALFKESERRFSSGCVRVEDAARLGKWLFGKPLPARTKTPEQRLDLPKPVAVYITYLTAAPEGDRIAFRDDAYNRDGVQMARLYTSRARGR